MVHLFFGEDNVGHTFLRRRVSPEYGFAELPEDTKALVLGGMPWSNCVSTGLRFKVPFAEMEKWGKEIDGISALYFHANNASGARFHIKMVFHPGEIMRKSLSRPAGKEWNTSKVEESYDRLLVDAMFYGKHVHKSGMEGVVVPKHYGLWDGKTRQGEHVIVSISEWGGLPYAMIFSGHVAFKQYDTEENR